MKWCLFGVTKSDFNSKQRKGNKNKAFILKQQNYIGYK